MVNKNKNITKYFLIIFYVIMIFKFVAWISFQMAFHLVVSKCFYMPRTYGYWFWNVYVRVSHVFHRHIV